METVQRHASRRAVVDLSDGKSWTLEQLHHRALKQSDQLPQNLQGARIGLSLPNHSEWIVRFLAIQKAGGVALPLDPSLNAEMRQEEAKRWNAIGIWEKSEFHPFPGKSSRTPGVALVKFTSGTTGTARALNCSHRAMITDGMNIIATMGIRSNDLQLGLIPLGHSYGLGNLLMPLILTGTPLALAPSFVPAQLTDWIHRYRPTVFPTVPILLKALSLLPSFRTMGTIRKVISAGARLEPEVARDFYKKFHRRIYNFYGASETGGICYDRTGWAAYSGRGIGTPLKGVQVRIGKDRQIRVTSDAITTGTRTETLADWGAWNSRGEVQLLGRQRAMINVGGKKLYPHEVEEAIRALPEIQEVWLEVVQHQGRDYLAAALETTRSETELRQELGKRLPEWKIPRLFHLCPQLPRNSRGKLDRVRIQALFTF